MGHQCGPRLPPGDKYYEKVKIKNGTITRTICMYIILIFIVPGPIPGPPRPHQQQHGLPPWRTPRGGRGAGPLLRHRQTQVLRSVNTDICPLLAHFPRCLPVKTSKLELETNAIRRFGLVSIVSYSRPSLMIIASASQFHVYLQWVNAHLA